MKAICAALACLGMTTADTAQTYPRKAVRIVVPYGTGGDVNTLANQLGASLQQLWGQGMIVDNRTGVSGNIGSAAVVRAPADG